MRCTNCGAENRDDHKYCGVCGTALALPTTPAKIATPTSASRQTSGNNGFNAAAGVMAFVEAIIVFCLVGWVVPLGVLAGMFYVLSEFAYKSKIISQETANFLAIIFCPGITTLPLIAIIWWAAYKVMRGRTPQA